jgi:hypothetical protein
VYQPFPKWKYHATEEAKIVTDEAEEHALGAGWHDSPSQVTANAATSCVAAFPSVPAAPDQLATTQASSAISNPSAPKPTHHKRRQRAKKTKRDSIKQAAATVQPPRDLKSEQNIAIWTALLKNPKASTKMLPSGSKER